MPKLRWIILPALAVAMVAGLVLLRHLDEKGTPEAAIRTAPGRVKAEQYELALRELTRAVDRAEDAGDEATLVAALRERAGVYTRTALFRQATEDLDTLLEILPDDTEILYEAGRTALLDEKYDDALRRFRRLIEVDPNHARGWSEVGTTHHRLAGEVLDRLRRHLETSLANEPVEEALALAGLITALPGESLRRQGATRRFFALLPEPDDHPPAAEFLELAFDHLTEARRAYLRSLEIWPDTDAIGGLLKLLERAQLSEEAADLGWFAFRTPGMQLQPRFLIETIEALERVGNDAAADRIAVEAVRDIGFEPYTFGLDPDEVPRLFDLEERTASWKPLLEQVGNFGDLVTWLELPYPNTVAYYAGVAHLGLGEELDGLSKLADVQQADEPYPTAYLDSLFIRLDVARAKQDLDEEKALMSAILANQQDLQWGEPNFLRVGQVSLRRGELFLRENLARQAETDLARALSLMPAAAAEIFPLWEEAGREASKSRGRTIEEVQDTFTRAPGYMPDQGYGSFEYFGTAQRFLHNTKAALGLHALGLIDREAPGIPQVLDLQAQLAQMLRRHDEEALALVRLGERTGSSPELLERLEALPAEAFDDDLALRRLRLDGNHIALPTMAREMADQGNVDEAIKALEIYRGDERLALRLLKADLYAESRRWRDCWTVFASGSDAIFARPGIALLSAAWGARGDDAISAVDNVVSSILASRPPADPDLTRAIDALFSEKRVDAALEVLEHLDRYPEHINAERLLRLGVAQAIELERREARETFSRAEAFIETGEPVIGRLIQAVDSQDWNAVVEAAFQLDDLRFGETPYRQALVRALEGDPALALERLEAIQLTPRLEPRRRLALAACSAILGPPDPENVSAITELFVHPSPLRPDPRAIVTMLITLEVDAFPAWTLVRLGDLPPELAPNTWALFLAAESTLALGNPHLADLLYRVLAVERGFAPAWLARGQIVAERYGEDSPEYLRFLDERIATLGAEALDSRTLLEYQSRSLAARGLPAQALALLQRALADAADDEADDEALVRLHTRLLVESGDRLAALSDYHRRLDAGTDEEHAELVPEVLELLNALVEGGELSEVGWWSEVEALEAQLGPDPALLRELVLRSIEAGDAESEAIAWSRAERFRRRVGNTSLETLRRGSTGPWFELFRVRDPARAKELVHEELLAHPASLDLWRLWARALDANGDTRGAWSEVTRFLPLFPDPELWRQGTRLMARLAQDPMTVQAAAARTARLSPAHRVELDFLPQLAAYRRGDEMSSARLQAAWDARKAIEDPLDVLLVARCYALTLMRSGSEEKRNLARHVLLEAVNYAPDPLNRDIMTAYVALSKAR